jgi:DNA-binding XRE family transcriptional regulator
MEFLESILTVTEVQQNIGTLIKKHRKYYKINQSDFAASMGISRETLIRIEKATNNCSLTFVLQILKHIGITYRINNAVLREIEYIEAQELDFYKDKKEL